MRKVKPHSMKKTTPVNAAALLQRLTERIAHTPPIRRPRARPKGVLLEPLREPLQTLRQEYRCSWPRLVELLAECGLQIHLSTLKRYLGPAASARAASLTGAPAVIPPRVSRPEPSDTKVPVVKPTPDSVMTPAPAPNTEAVPPRHEVTPSRLHLASRFTPKPEVPYPELIRQAAARKHHQDTATASDDTPGSSGPPTPSA